MISQSIFLTSLILINASNFIKIPKINLDSIVGIGPDLESYTSRSTNAITVGMKNGKQDTLLYNKDGLLNPGTLATSANNEWFSIANPKWKFSKGNCGILLCSLRYGMCKCDDVVADTGFYFADLDESEMGGCHLLKEAEKSRKGTKKSGKKEKEIILSEDEMTKRFLGDFNKSTKL